MEDFGDRRKRRHDAAVEEAGSSSPAAKRFRDDFLPIDVLDDDADAGEGEAVVSVMKSLEEEIGVPSSSPAPAVAPGQPDLGFLFGASDDELGLPPPAAYSSEESGDASAAAVMEVADGGEVDGIGFGQIWGFADEMNGYDGLDWGIRAEEWEAEGEEGLVFEGGLFDHADVLGGGGPFDCTEISWKS